MLVGTLGEFHSGQEPILLLGPGYLFDAYHGAFPLFSRRGFQLALFTVDLILHIAADNKVNRFHGSLRAGPAGVMVPRSLEDKIVLLLLFILGIGRARWLNILQDGRSRVLFGSTC